MTVTTACFDEECILNLIYDSHSRRKQFHKVKIIKQPWEVMTAKEIETGTVMRREGQEVGPGREAGKGSVMIE